MQQSLMGFYWIKIKSSGDVVIAHIVGGKAVLYGNSYSLDVCEVLRPYRVGVMSLVEMCFLNDDPRVYEVEESCFVEVQHTHSCNPYWHKLSSYKPSPGDKVLREKRVNVYEVGYFDSREQFIEMMERSHGKLITIVEE